MHRFRSLSGTVLTVNGAEANSFGKKLQCINGSAQYIIYNFDLIFQPKFKFKSWEIAHIVRNKSWEIALYLCVGRLQKIIFQAIRACSSPIIVGQTIKSFVCLKEINSLVSLY